MNYVFSLYADADDETSQGQQPGLFMSKTFYPCEADPPDLILVSEDGVFFALQRHRLLTKSSNLFGRLLIADGVSSLNVTESSEVINLVLHIFYDLEPASCSPSLDHIDRMLSALPKYGLALAVAIISGTPIYKVIMGLAYTAPLDAFAVVCHHNLEELAVETSRLLLSVPLLNLTNQHCITMGPIYLRRLIFLHVGRTERLKALLEPLPAKHPRAIYCDKTDQRLRLEDAWIKVSTSLAWYAHADTSISLLYTDLTSTVEKLACTDCKASMRERIRQVIVDWASVKQTI